MCGICGFIKFNSQSNEDDRRIILKMNKKLFHRGPDAQDIFLKNNLVFGFSRLSIIGLEDGMQPLFNEDGTIILICNGEIFNYIELRHFLKSKGHQFKTSTDVEVILHLYEDYGMNFLNKLNGQFAFALYDFKKNTFFAARDHLGIIPFFYTYVNKTFIFGSEIKAILEHPLVKAEADVVGLDQVFSFAGLISPRTMFKNIYSLENGHFLCLNDQGVVYNEEYWDLIYPEGEIISNESEDFYIQELEELFDSSVRLRLRSDVPSALYLSGGLDSSMITMKVKQLNKEITKEVFSIDFIDSNNSESIYQKLIANECGYPLNQKTFFYDDISERLAKSIYFCETPIKETYNTASLSLSEAVRAKNIKVVLSGEGADEFFAGYVGYRFDKMRGMNLIQNHASISEQELRNKIWGDNTFFYERNFLDFDIVKRQMYSSDLNSDYDKVNCLNHFVINKDRIHNRNVLNKRAYIDYKLRLVDHLVSDHGDRMALANSVEVRYPFLDKNLIEFSTKIPSELKLNGFTEKYILKKISEKFLPKSIFEREKFHFIAPGSPYLIQKNIEYINDILSYNQIKKQGFFNPDHIEKLKKEYKQDGFTINAPYESDLLITVITFGIFLDTFIK